MTDKELPDRQALAGSLGLDAAGEEPLDAAKVRLVRKVPDVVLVVRGRGLRLRQAERVRGREPPRDRQARRGKHAQLLARGRSAARRAASRGASGHGGGAAPCSLGNNGKEAEDWASVRSSLLFLVLWMLLEIVLLGVVHF